MSDKAGSADSRASFVDVIKRAAIDDGTLPGHGGGDDRRTQLLEYRKRVEQARLEHQVRLERLGEAQAKIEAELARMEAEDQSLRTREVGLKVESKEIDDESLRLVEERARLDSDRIARAAERQRIDEETRRLEQENRELEQRRAEQAVQATRLAEEEERARQQRAELAANKVRREEEAARETAAHEQVVEQRRQQVDEIHRQLIAQNPSPLARTSAVQAKAAALAPKGVRRAPRFEIHAAVRFNIPGDTIVMRARNISMTGALLATEPATMSKFPIGSEHTAMVFVSAAANEQIAVHAQVVRHDGNDIVIDWSSDVESSFRVALLIATLPAE